MEDNNSSSLRKQAHPIIGKGKKKKKQEKDEADRIKQAEKKKRRLEKALATSLAIRVELEKKKQRYKEGHQQADEESLADAAKKKKKKQDKDELERIKQAKKKMIHLEKAIANSAAIRAELEKKKLKKLEEQRRLDEEGAAIAEAVALHVLRGEDSDDSYRTMLNQETSFKPWDYTAKLNLFTGGRNAFSPQQCCSSPAVHMRRGNCNCSISYGPFARGWDNNNMGISADLIAAQAVSTLQISENARVDAVVFNGMFRR